MQLKLWSKDVFVLSLLFGLRRGGGGVLYKFMLNVYSL
jgi:hypothetical protein